MTSPAPHPPLWTPAINRFFGLGLVLLAGLGISGGVLALRATERVQTRGRRAGEILSDVIAGTHVVDERALLASRLLLSGAGIWAILFIALLVWMTVRRVRRISPRP